MKSVGVMHLAIWTLLSLGQSAKGLTYDVFFNNFSFSPAVVNIQVGDTVRWSNLGGTHTVTGTGADPICGNGTVATSQSVTFTAVGSFPYRCNFHFGSGMTGLVVVAASTGPPTILNGPTNVAAAAGSAVTLSVTAVGAAPLLYQWRKNLTDIPMATNATFQIPMAGASDAGNYLCVVTNAFGAVTSGVAAITVGDPPYYPPSFTQHPLSQTVSVSNSVSFGVSAVGTVPLSFQWIKDGTNLPGATGSTLSLAIVRTNDSGTYVCRVSNSFGVTSSVAALLAVNRLTQTINFGSLTPRMFGDAAFTLTATSSSGLPVSFTSSDSAVAMVSGNQVALVGDGITSIIAIQSGNQNYSSVSVTQSLTVLSPPRILTQPTSSSVNVAGSATVLGTITGTAPLSYQWFGLTSLLAGATGTALVAGGFVFDAQVVSGGSGYVQTPAVRFVGGGGSGATATATVNNGAVVALTIVNPGSGYTSPPTVQIDPPSGFLAGQTNATLTLINVSTNDAGTYFVVVTNAYGSVTSSPATLTVNVPVAITQQPQGVITTLGSNVSFTVAASGTMPLSHQWFWQPAMSRTALAVSDVRNGFVVGATVLYGGGYYSTPPAVQILGGGGASATATVNNGVVTALNIVSPGSGYPSNAVIQIAPPVAGTTQFLSGQAGATLNLPAVGALASGSYYLVITNAGGSVTSSPALLRVLVPQRFMQPPQRLGDGTFRLLFGAHDGGFLLTNDLAGLEVWGSTNLANTNAWVRITNGITVQSGQVQVDDADSPGLPRRFYRVLTR
jgi:plastocyanin